MRHLSHVKPLAARHRVYDFDLGVRVLDESLWAGMFPRPENSDKPSLLRAVQEQLGLKLESTRGAVDAVVIDHVERPTSD
jgi:uncharacterized protein (TIGR03435 family)